jgi:hypothetical protein
VSGAVETVDAALSSQEDELRVEEEVFLRLFARPRWSSPAPRAAGTQSRDGERNLEALHDGIIAAGVAPNGATPWTSPGRMRAPEKATGPVLRDRDTNERRSCGRGRL